MGLRRKVIGWVVACPCLVFASDSYQDNPVFRDALEAVQNLNRVASNVIDNPLDTSQRIKVRLAKANVDRKLAELRAELERGNLTPDGLEQATTKLAEYVEVPSASSRTGRTLDPIKTSTTIESVSNSIKKTTEPSVTPAEVTPSQASNGVKVNITVINGSVSPAKNNFGPLETATIPVPESKEKMARIEKILFGEGSEIESETYSGSRAPMATGSPGPGVIQAEIVSTPKKAVFNSIVRKVSRANLVEYLAGEFGDSKTIQSVIPAQSKDLHVTGNYRGGRLVLGSLGPGVAALHFKRDPATGTLFIRALSKAQLWIEFFQVAGLTLITLLFLLWIFVPRFRKGFILSTIAPSRSIDTKAR